MVNYYPLKGYGNKTPVLLIYLTFCWTHATGGGLTTGPEKRLIVGAVQQVTPKCSFPWDMVSDVTEGTLHITAAHSTVKTVQGH